MAERKGPEGERPWRDPIDSGQQEDRSRSSGERDDETTDTEANGGRPPAAEDVTAARTVTSEENSAETDEDGVIEPAEESADNVLSFHSRTRTESESPEQADPGARPEGTPTSETADSADERSDNVERGGAHDDPALLDSDEIGEPVDLTALRQDDALLDALGGTNPEVPERSGTGPNVADLLVSWRQDIDSAPIGELVDLDRAASTIEQARRPQRRGWFRRRHLVPVATAAAVLMIGCTGVGVAARDALPGDMLWGVAQVFYSDHAQGVQAATSARESLRTAETALDDGDPGSAESALESAQQRMHSVDDEHGLSDLRAAHASLSARVEDGVPPGDDPTTEVTTSEETPPPTSEETSPSSEPENPLPPPTEEPTTTPPTTSTDDPTTPPTTTTSETSETSEESSTDSPWGSSEPLLPGNEEETTS